MKSLRAIFCSAVFVLVAAGLCGCFPGAEGQTDEEKDPHFQRGRDLVNSQEFKAAVDEFEKALETNPRSAAAHFELGWIYDDKLDDYAAAIYHYQRHLSLKPNSERAQRVQDRIRGCKLKLASTEFPLPNSQNLQQQVDRLNEENRLLKLQLDAARNRSVALAPAPTPAPAPSAVPVRLAVAQPIAPVPVANISAHPRIYIVKEKDNLSAIARRYNIKLSALLAANPNISPTRLHIGDSLNLP